MSEVKKIPDGWVETTLGANLTEIAMGPFGSNLKVDMFTESGVPVIKGGNLLESFVGGDFSFVSEEKATSLRKAIAYPDDLIITHRGTLGQVSLVPKNKFERYVTSQSQLRLSVNPKKLNHHYLLYFFKSRLGQYELLKNASQVGVPAISTPTKSVKEIDLTIPSNIKEQEAIADILIAFDDKIQLLQAQNKTLEETAQTIFAEWFGKYTIDVKLPDGWRFVKLGNELETYLGGTPSKTKSEFWENGTIPWINSGKVNDFRIIEPSDYISVKGLKKSATKLLPKGTVVIAITGATLGQYSRLEVDCCFNQSVVGIKENEKIHSSYIYFWIAENIGNIIRHATGGAQQHINKENVNQTKFLLPSEDILEKFYVIADPIMHKISYNMLQIQTLTKTRDELLPSLMSGEIRVNEFKG